MDGVEAMWRPDVAWEPRASGPHGSGGGPDDAGPSNRGDALSARVASHWRAQSWTRPGDRVIVACSGGLDSLTLLHLVRFSLEPLGLRVDAAHFDHRMREGTDREVAWLRGVAGAWGVPLHVAAASESPHDEARARALRYGFLENLLREGDARWVLTAHHADDQIETVLFRLLRGTGLDGLRGIPTVREPGVLRPLLPFFREELEAYARSAGLRPRIDPTNRSLRFARNRVRHRLLPLMEDVHPGARQAILRLSRNAHRSAAALSELLRAPIEEVVIDSSPDRVVLDRDAFLAKGEPIGFEILRWAARILRAVPSESGTAVALEFITRGSSGAGVRLSGSLTVSREFDRILLTRNGSREEKASLAIGTGGLDVPSPEWGEGALVVGGRRYMVQWGATTASPHLGQGDTSGLTWEWCRFDLTELRFPLRFRGWRDGDATRAAGGGKKLKKLFGELRLPRGERHRVPLLVDAEGLVIWIPGWHRVPPEADAADRAGSGPWFAGIGRFGGL